MRTCWKWALVLAVPVVLAGAGRAGQDELITPADTTVKLILLRQKSVQQELKLSPEVVQKVMEFTNKESREYGLSAKLKKAEAETKSKELEREEMKFLDDNLNAEQRKRLRQITLQVTGLQQLTRPAVAKVLNLTEEQQQKFRAMQQAAHAKMAELLKAKKGQGRSEKLAKLREAINTKIEAILTDEQKAKARELVGEPFRGELRFEDDADGPTSSLRRIWRATPLAAVTRATCAAKDAG
jgi:hypothetical protein